MGQRRSGADARVSRLRKGSAGARRSHTFHHPDSGSRAGGTQLVDRPQQAQGLQSRVQRLHPEKVARYSAARIDKLTTDPGIIRNRLKIAAAVKNARAFLAVQGEYGSFDAYCWQFVDGRPRQNRWKTMRQIPATTRESDAFSGDLKRRGFSLVWITGVEG